MPDDLNPLFDNLTITELTIDGMSDSFVRNEFESPILSVGDSISVGGIPDQFTVVVAESFRGCIGEVIINGRYVCSSAVGMVNLLAISLILIADF